MAMIKVVMVVFLENLSYLREKDVHQLFEGKCLFRFGLCCFVVTYYVMIFYFMLRYATLYHATYVIFSYV